jgi:magnesium chelatase subunit I
MPRSTNAVTTLPDGASRPPSAATVRDLRAGGYRHRSVKDELRENTIARLREGKPLFDGIVGYEKTVVPALIDALLAKHDTLLLGLRGQAKTRLLRAMVNLLDEWTPVLAVEGCELPDDPLAASTRAGRDAIAELGDDAPISWMHRSERYLEKLATPDVTVADLIGDIDIVKHAQGHALADERSMHFGLIPRANRGIFVINELPDLAPRIQVALFNVLEERDVQIRGYPVRLNLDVCLMFSANPEDYTNRGRIVTPLKDRIGSVIRTHYPSDTKEAMRITRENAFVERVNGEASKSPRVRVPSVMHEILEETIAQARRSPHINQASGVSVRASIALLEALVSAAERRAIVTGEKEVAPRVCDMTYLPAACRGKIELMLAEEGASGDGRSTEDRLIEAIMGEAVKKVVARALPAQDAERVVEGFTKGLKLELGDDVSAKDAVASMEHVPGLLDAARAIAKKVGLNANDEQDLACAGELALECLYVSNRLSKYGSATGGGAAYAR